MEIACYTHVDRVFNLRTLLDDSRTERRVA